MIIDSEFVRVVPAATGQPWTVVGLSRQSWYRLERRQGTPPPVRLGARRKVWLIVDLVHWLECGAPPRAKWERMRQAEKMVRSVKAPADHGGGAFAHQK